jgi:hypothetical protein
MLEDRRDFLHKLFWGTGATLLFPNLAFGQEKAKGRGITIADLLTLAYPAVLAALQKGNKWINPELNKRQEEGLIRSMMLGAIVHIPLWGGGVQDYPTEQIVTPMVWTDMDEANANTENKKVSLATSLLENGLQTHDDMLLDKMGNGQMIVSKHYVYNLTKAYRLESQRTHVVQIYTAAAFIPRKELIWQKNEQFYFTAGQAQAKPLSSGC